MKDKIIEIIQQYKFDHIPEKQAVNELLGLFSVIERFNVNDLALLDKTTPVRIKDLGKYQHNVMYLHNKQYEEVDNRRLSFYAL